LDGNQFELQGRVRDLTPVTHVTLIAILVAFLEVFKEVATQSEAWVWGSSLAGTAGSNPAGDIDVCLS